MSTEAFSPARAGLAQCLDSLAQQHARRWNQWLLSGGAPGGGDGGAAAVRCVTFDLDDTLFPLMPPLLRASAVLIDELLPRHLPRSAAAGACTKDPNPKPSPDPTPTPKPSPNPDPSRRVHQGVARRGDARHGSGAAAARA